MRNFILSALLLFLHATGITAQAQFNESQNYYGIDYHAKAAYFNFQNAKQQSLYVFSLSIADNGDIYFHMSGPVEHCWVGVGFGSSMKDALMFIAYPAANGTNTTTSARISTGYSEPVYAPEFQLQKIQNDTYAPNANLVTENGTGTIISHVVCKNCTTWNTPNGPRSLDLFSKAQNFIFALGPNITFRSDSPAASLPRHAFVGNFDMDLTVATNYTGWYGRVPAPNVPDFHYPPNDTSFASFASTPAYDTRSMDNPLPGAHGAMMLVAFVFLFPTGALVMQFLRRVLWHAAIQVIGFILVFAGFGVAVHVSGQYNKSKHYSSPHQIIGLVVVACLAIQLGLGLMHHAIYARSKKPTPFGRFHFFFGPLIIILGLVNGGLGFHFASNHHWLIPYAIVVAIVGFIFVALVGGYIWYSTHGKKYQPEQETAKELKDGDSDDYEMSGPSPAASFGPQIPEPYSPTTPYAASFSHNVPAPYDPTTPYSAISANTPSSFRKDGVNNWPSYFFQEGSQHQGKF